MLCLDRTLTLVLATHFLRARSGANLSAPQISEEYDQRKNVKKKLEEQLVDIRKQLHENYNSFKSNNEFLHYNYKTLPTTPTQWAKGTTLIVGDSVLYEIDENRLSFPRSHYRWHEIFLETVFKTLTNKHNFTLYK